MARITSIHAQWWSLHSPPALQFSPPGGGLWQPAINAFRCGQSLRICVDLAGVEREEIEVQVESRRLTIRGVRSAPEPWCGEEEARQVLALEIDSGPFSRELTLPLAVKVEEVTAQQRQGLLWIDLPLAENA
jgi:HSP20 family protein